MVITFLCNGEVGKIICHRNTSLDSKSVLLSITGTCPLVLRRGDIDAVAQGELDTTGVVVFHLAEHHTVAVEYDMVDTAIKEIVACQLDIQTAFEKVFADAEREHSICTINPDI